MVHVVKRSVEAEMERMRELRERTKFYEPEPETESEEPSIGVHVYHSLSLIFYGFL